MAAPVNLGQIIDSATGLGESPPPTYDAINAAASSSSSDISDKDVADKAVSDAKEIPSIWFVNFPTQQAAAQQAALKEYTQEIQDYRCWASLIWWRTVYANPQIPQDGSKESIAARSAYAAKVGVHHMKQTPWLAMNVDHNISRQIECQTSEFHFQLLDAVLAGFVGVTPVILQALEGILKSLAKTVDQSVSNTDSKTIVCERYEYVPEVDLIRSYVRLVSFTVTDSMRNVEKAKSSERLVTCTIDYNEYEATFNRKLWGEASDKIEDEQKKVAEDFVDQGTVDCPP
ncbi:hypothetical protein BDV28DRAFT_127289 [Aspergillus coremiiformis]|uniref:Uncharacterized protein n=1 Tax=Aspergillus coremiiformis TaxID=138285 RepID=A0A5N6ZJB5_9EURO|nr:hypothetical protein BDV28DRAFT_127289 [Aspergillus coremiiformis]